MPKASIRLTACMALGLFLFPGNPLASKVMAQPATPPPAKSGVAPPGAPSAALSNIFDDNWTPPKRNAAATPEKTPSATPPNTTPLPSTPDTTSPAAPVIRLPIPAKADQVRSRALLKELFAGQMTDASLTARRKLSGILLETVAKTSDNPVDQYVLLGGAINAAREGADLPKCLKAADQLSGMFDVDALALKADAALNMPLKAAAAGDTSDNIRAALELVHDLIAEDDLASANRLCGLLKPLAVTDAALRPIVNQRSNEVAALRAAQERIASVLQTLKTAPNDPRANQALGEYYCFSRGWWNKGLPYLFKGADAEVKKAAADELSGATNSAGQAALGDAWWNLGEKQTEPARGNLREHAVTFYRMAVGGATGLAKLKIEGRIAQLAAVPTPGVPVAAGPVNPPKPEAVGIQIISAKWGLDTRIIDVTPKVISLYQEKTTIDVASRFLGDPAVGDRKELTCQFQIGLSTLTVTQRENNLIRILKVDAPKSPDATFITPQVKLVSAVFGASQRTRNVKDKVAAVLKSGSVMKARSDALGIPDPAPLTGKSLVLRLEIDGQAYEVAITEDGSIALPRPNPR